MDDEVLTASETRMIADETVVLHHVQAELARVLAKPVGGADFDQELLSLRDQIAESRAEDHAMLVEHMTRLSMLRAAQNRDYAPPVDPRNPYFGRLHLVDQQKGKRRERDVLIGRRAFIDTKRGVQIVDWRNSPISRIYYCYVEDDDYEECFANELQVGKVVLRRSLNIADGELVRVRQGEQTLVRNEAGQWQRLSVDRSRLAGGVGVAIRAPSERLAGDGPDHRLAEITALIDPVQFRIITDEQSGLVIIRGGAGTGKTTIALHRVAYLAYQDLSPVGSADRQAPDPRAAQAQDDRHHSHGRPSSQAPPGPVEDAREYGGRRDARLRFDPRASGGTGPPRRLGATPERRARAATQRCGAVATGRG
jgi:DNA helicase-2/ATP-dependent DNA helicase PcrA